MFRALTSSGSWQPSSVSLGSVLSCIPQILSSFLTPSCYFTSYSTEKTEALGRELLHPPTTESVTFQEPHPCSYLRPRPPPVLSTPGGDALTPCLPELQAFFLYWVFSGLFLSVYKHMIIYFPSTSRTSSLRYLHGLPSHFIQTNSILSERSSLYSHLQYRLPSFLRPSLLSWNITEAPRYFLP